MTAAELFEIMRDVPREAWGELDWYCGEFVKKHTYDVVDSDVAEDAFIGSMTAWLIDQDNSVKSWSPMGEFDGERFRPAAFVVALNEDDLDEAKPHHSLVAALAAACKEEA